MKTSVTLRPQPKLELHYTPVMEKSLQVLTWNRAELMRQLRLRQKSNPYLRTIQSDWLNFTSSPTSLKADLCGQLSNLKQPIQKHICQILIESLNDQGFLDDSLQDLAQTFHVPLPVLERHLSWLQQLEPAGVGARNAQECLILQLQRFGYQKAIEFLTVCEAEILTHDWQKAAVKMTCSPSEILNYFHQLQECSPAPCASYEAANVQWILPEFEVRVEDHHCILESIEEPNLSLDQQPPPALRQALQEARFFLDALSQRNLTLSLIMNELLLIQEKALIHHLPLRACQKKEIAEKLGLHPSTITRAVQDKYFLFEGKLLPIEMLFASLSADNLSQDELISQIRTVIAQESPDFPLSDLQITMRLQEKQIQCSRQLIAKLRKKAGIPASYKRKRINS